MGNAQITIHHPTSIRVHSPTLEWGKVIPGSNTTFRISKRDGCWTGCGGYVLISRDVKESKWTYSFKNTSKFDIRCSLTGTGSAKPRVSTTAGDQVVAEGNICAKLLEFGMTWEEARESIVLVNAIVKFLMITDTRNCTLMCLIMGILGRITSKPSGLGMT